MPTSESETMSMGKFLGLLAVILVAFGGAWAGYNYFQPATVPPPVPGQYNDTIQWMSIKDGEEEFKKGKKCILYDFTAEWCHFCKIQDAEVYQIKPVAQFINQYFIPITVMDRAREDGKNPPEVSELQRKYSINGFPTLVVRYPDDKFKKDIGFRAAELTVNFLKQAVNIN